MRSATGKQREVLLFIDSSIKANGFPPSMREVADNFKISNKAAYDRLQALRKKELINWQDGKARTVAIMESGFVELQQARK